MHNYPWYSQYFTLIDAPHYGKRSFKFSGNSIEIFLGKLRKLSKVQEFCMIMLIHAYYIDSIDTIFLSFCIRTHAYVKILATSDENFSFLSVIYLLVALFSRIVREITVMWSPRYNLNSFMHWVKIFYQFYRVYSYHSII